MRRKYDKRRRAETEGETRRRIVEATVHLHETLGPARTQVSAIAELAGVERVTVYRHFPDPADLFQACRSHFIQNHPLPDDSWKRIGDPAERVRAALTGLYRYYGRNERMVNNILRDSEVLPVGQGFIALREDVVKAVSEGWNFDGGDRKRLLATLDVVADFKTWRTLVRRRKLSLEQAVNLAATWVQCVRES